LVGVQFDPNNAMQCDSAELLTTKLVESVSASAEMPVTHKLVEPVTVTEVLGPDKGRIQKANNSKHCSEASKKSVQILSKFWGDVVDSDTTDGTMDPDTDNEKMNMHPVALKYLEAQPDANHQPKSTRKSRKTSSSARGKGSDGITSSDPMQTRLKKGVIKSNPKYV
jgi:hypothetical protein